MVRRRRCRGVEGLEEEVAELDKAKKLCSIPNENSTKREVCNSGPSQRIVLYSLHSCYSSLASFRMLFSQHVSLY